MIFLKKLRKNSRPKETLQRIRPGCNTTRPAGRIAELEWLGRMDAAIPTQSHLQIDAQSPTFLEQWVAGTYLVTSIFPTDGRGLTVERMIQQIPAFYTDARSHKRAMWPRGYVDIFWSRFTLPSPSRRGWRSGFIHFTRTGGRYGIYPFCIGVATTAWRSDAMAIHASTDIIGMVQHLSLTWRT